MRFKISICISILLIGCTNVSTTKEKPRTVANMYREDINYLAKYGNYISLDEAVQIARNRNLDIKIKKIESKIATLDKKIAFGNFLPSIGVSGGYTQMNSELNLDGGSLGDIPFLDKESNRFGINAQIPIFVPSLWYLYSARQKGEDISKMVEELIDKKIQLQVMGQYYYILSLESKDKTLKSELAIAKELEKKGKVSLEIEAILPWEYQKLELNIKNKEFSLTKNKRELDIIKMNFMKTLNLNPLTNFNLEETVVIKKENLTMEEAIFKALNQNDIIKITDIESKISDDKIKIAITNFLPKIVLGGGYVSNSNSILSDPDFLYGNISVIVSLFNGFKNINEYKKSVKMKEISELKVEKEFLKVIVETANAYKKVQIASELMDLAELNYASEQGKLKQNENEKIVGNIDEIEYLTAVSSYEKSYTQLKQSEFQYKIAKGSLKIAMGENPVKGEKRND